MSFSMLTINADNHAIMKQFHRPEDEKRSFVVLQDSDYTEWLSADQEKARSMLKLANIEFLKSEASPIKR